MKNIYRISIQLISLCTLVLFSIGAMAQSKAKVENVDFFLENENLVITYDIVKSKSGETFNVKVNIITTTGKNISAFALSGDVGPGVYGGSGKKIVWDLNKDNAYIDDEISVEVFIESELTSNKAKPAETAKAVSVGGALLRSAVFPGWGNRHIKGKGAYWLMGLLGYGAVGGSIYMNNQADKAYTDYKNSRVAGERDQLYKDAEDYHQNQQTLMYAAAGIWVIDLIWTGIQAGNANKRAKQSKVDMGYYYNPVVRGPMVSFTYSF